ncbi:ectoine/hydroxyectoine ABC transporter permease subunit EhuC [Nitratireductor sp. GZWM139]|uniref:ectoine/hydroxyectoine ABC transporter permease subunit EhuC n=1 Tax=Nitratireductor sp. GZWM139 TaxID=2950541 RepID=UPI0024BE2538|nr:ectoine/hydroxyectoine ABC transporter permease subunit EhuC [Nitratireductor sp. GZWM139]MDJ1466112.1 ectoine/hydroxyectoine ABC transporter permease subunit EhuC [Nitratireductor sp. GZWM139]
MLKLPDSPPFDLLPQLLAGALLTLELTVIIAIVGFLLAFPVAMARTAQNKFVRLGATAYVEVLRGTSAMVQLFVLFFILPAYGLRLDPKSTAIIALSLNMSAYGSEIVRGAISSIEQGQREAAAALGLTRFQTWRLVILPQAFVTMLPSFGNQLVELLKATSLVSLITLTDLTFAGRQMVVTTGRDLEVWGLVLLLYLAMAYPLTLLARYAERRAATFRR